MYYDGDVSDQMINPFHFDELVILYFIRKSETIIKS